MNRLLLVPGLALLLGACASSPSTTTMSDPTVNLRDYETFNFVQYDQSPDAAYETLEAGYLKAAARRELETRGFTFSDDPDLLVNFSVDTQEKLRTRTVPRSTWGVGYDPFYDVYYEGWGTTHETRIDQYTEGYLDIDLIDAEQRKLVWQGTTKGRLTEKDYENVQQTLELAVREIFQQFPIPGPGN